jgi:hypothetical protein
VHAGQWLVLGALQAFRYEWNGSYGTGAMPLNFVDNFNNGGGGNGDSQDQHQRQHQQFCSILTTHG